MTDNEIRDGWNFSKMVAINIGSVTLSKEDVLAIDDLMNRQKAEIERLQSMNQAKLDMIHDLRTDVETARAEAVKEFAERLRGKIDNFREKREMVMLPYTEAALICIEKHIDNLVKEFTEGG